MLSNSINLIDHSIEPKGAPKGKAAGININAGWAHTALAQPTLHLNSGGPAT